MVDTYVDPKTNKTYDYGVATFLDLGKSKDFFNRFDVAVDSNREAAPFATEIFDFTTGKPVDLTPAPVDGMLAAFEKFLTVVEPWTDYLQPGYWNFPDPADIPADFLIPFGDFVTKYGVEDAVSVIYGSTGLGLGNMAKETTMFVLQSFGTYMAEAITGKRASYTPIQGGNIALYEAIEKDLGHDVLYQSTVIDSKRTDHGVSLTVKNHATGEITKLHARQLLMAIEPTAENMAPFDLRPTEKSTLSKFTYTREYAGIVDNSAFADGIQYSNLPSSASPSNYLALPDTPFVNTITSIGGEHLYHVIIVGDDHLDESGAKALMQDTFTTLLKAGDLAEPAQGQEINWVAFKVHGPMHARVTPEEVKAGFFQQLYTLQGDRSTWWTGGAFACNFQTTLWDFDETLFPKILAALDGQGQEPGSGSDSEVVTVTVKACPTTY